MIAIRVFSTMLSLIFFMVFIFPLIIYRFSAALIPHAESGNAIGIPAGPGTEKCAFL